MEKHMEFLKNLYEQYHKQKKKVQALGFVLFSEILEVKKLY